MKVDELEVGKKYTIVNDEQDNLESPDIYIINENKELLELKGIHLFDTSFSYNDILFTDFKEYSSSQTPKRFYQTDEYQITNNKVIYKLGALNGSIDIFESILNEYADYISFSDEQLQMILEDFSKQLKHTTFQEIMDMLEINKETKISIYYKDNQFKLIEFEGTKFPDGIELESKLDEEKNQYYLVELKQS